MSRLLHHVIRIAKDAMHVHVPHGGTQTFEGEGLVIKPCATRRHTHNRSGGAADAEGRQFRVGNTSGSACILQRSGSWKAKTKVSSITDITQKKLDISQKIMMRVLNSNAQPFVST